MKRKIIHIDKDRCNGCGACAAACHEGAIGMVDGKAELLRDDYCDGMGDCLPECPTGAISFEEREAAPYNVAAVLANKHKNHADAHGGHGGCPGARAQQIHHGSEPSPAASGTMASQLRQWPVQIKLAPVNAPYFQGAELLIAADCTAYAYANFHQEFIRGRITLIGCPKLDAVDYSEKLAEIIRTNNIRSATIVRMEVPCCGGLEMAVKAALRSSGKSIPCRTVIVSIDGRLAAEDHT